MGSASFFVALLSGLLVILYIEAARLFQDDPGIIHLLSWLGPVLVLLVVLLAFSGVLLGWKGLSERGANHLFGLTGVIVNGAFFLGILALIIINLIEFL